MKKRFIHLNLAVCLATLLLIAVGGFCHPHAGQEVVMKEESSNNQTSVQATEIAKNLDQSTPSTEPKAAPQMEPQGLPETPGSAPEEKVGDPTKTGQTGDTAEPSPEAIAPTAPAAVQRPPFVTEDTVFGEIVLFSTLEHEPYAAVKLDNRVVTAPVGSLEFKMMLAKAIYYDTGSIPSEKDLKDAVHDYTYQAFFSPFKFPIHTRCAMLDGEIHIDLGDETGDRVIIGAKGWNVVPSQLAPPFFRRPGGMLPLPRPEGGGSIKSLAKFLNLKGHSEDHLKLIVGWLVDALYPDGPYMMLVLNGPQGSAKSTTLKILRDLIDPVEGAMLSLPTSERDMFIAGSKIYLLSYDNVSELKDKLSDAFCRMINDGTFRTRKLYTNLDEIIIKLRRPVIFNGISHFVRQNDFMDRAIFIELPTIRETQRRAEGNLLAEWKKAQPQILGALYDLAAVALQNVDTVQLQRLPRMADSARWVSAAESEGIWENGSFLEAYQHNRQGMVDLTIESDPVAVGVLNLLNERSGWTGTHTDLLEKLQQVTPEGNAKAQGIPKGL